MSLLRARRHHSAHREHTLEPVTIRLAGADDDEGIARVAGRDSGAVPPAPRLVAQRDGVIEAALSLRTGELVADPFRHTADLVELLRCHAAARRPAAAGGPPAPRRAEPAGGRLDLGLAGAGGCR